MSAMLALIASDELKIGKGRRLRFVETYIGEFLATLSHRNTIAQT